MSKTQKKKNPIKELGLEIDILDQMLSSLVEVLEEKGVMTSEEWERKIKAKIEHVAKTQKSFRDVET
jgi:hypothetical protein